MVWKIKQLGGGKEFLMRAHFGLPSVKSEDTVDRRTPISIKFEIPYFTVSGIQVRYLKIVEKSGYQALRKLLSLENPLRKAEWRADAYVFGAFAQLGFDTLRNTENTTFVRRAKSRRRDWLPFPPEAPSWLLRSWVFAVMFTIHAAEKAHHPHRFCCAESSPSAIPHNVDIHTNLQRAKGIKQLHDT